MLDNIKSSYITQILFSYLTELHKLKLAKYSKKLKNKILCLINYKIYSGRYIIYETKFKGKEYNGYNNKLIYEGEYLNGERNGTGKEFFDNGYLKYNGQFLKGKKHGIGKEYFDNGEIKYKGEYFNGKIIKGKLYDFSVIFMKLMKKKMKKIIN